ncbi:MAG: DNA polymerase III subunit delta [Alphaproteobacteria bacterium]|nr:DNA polymerase III subunit delta [Alphaproteobacteria bacterium]
MKLAFKQIESFVKSPDPAARVILAYGPDDGLMRERAQMMGRTVVADLNDPFNAVTLDAKQLVDDPARLMDEALALSMMGGARLIRVENADDKITALIKDYLTNPSKQNLIILEAAELGPRSSLRLLAEKSANAAALPCYVEDERDLGAVIRDTMSTQGFRIAPDAAAWLAAAAVGNRARVRSEIEKLITYMGSERTINLEDVQASTGDAGMKSFDDLVYATAGANPAAALRAFDALTGEGTAIIAILRTLQNHFRRLHLVRAKLDAGDPLDIIIKSLQPPIFFKQDAPFRAQVMRWQLPMLEKILQRLATLEADCKKTGTPDIILCRQAILSISSIGAKKRAA